MADSGAHFHRCDLQVHTPRDLNWSGKTPASEVERGDFATAFVQACRDKGLDAVAITDHHDFAFFKYIKAAAENEVDLEGNRIARASRLTVFPGMELTFGMPCQALLILDADFPESMLESIYSALAITPTDPLLEKCRAPEPIAAINYLDELHKRLDEHSHLENRYIVLPHVSDGGHKTLLRTGFQSHYVRMPCVGGYVDGPITKVGSKQRIVDGQDRNYGNKRIGVFATSDSRSGDFSQLGVHCTWVKWARPTAEALRQACLARDTRISHSEPELPSVYIESLQVNHSKFMGPIDLSFNPQLSCLIGGRGTGKSTILEYLRWALCDQPPAFAADIELPDYQTKRTNLIQNTLVPLDAVVTVNVQVNGVMHQVRQRARDGHLTLKIGDGQFEERGEGDIRALLPLQGYSQKQLSAVGVRNEELIRFIRLPVKQELSQFSIREGQLRIEIKKQYAAVRSKRDAQRQVQREELELDSLSKQEKSLRAHLRGLSEEDQKTLARNDAYNREETSVVSTRKAISQAEALLNDTVRSISAVQGPPLPTNVPNAELIGRIDAAASALLQSVKESVSKLAQSLQPGNPSVDNINAQIAEWQQLKALHEKEYELAKQKASSQQKLLDQIKEVEEKSKLVRDALAERQRSIATIGSPEDRYEQLRHEWSSLYRARADLLSKKCEELTALSDGKIRARLVRGGGFEQVQKKLEGIIAGTRIRTRKVELLCEIAVQHADTIQQWYEILNELEQLAMRPKSEEFDSSSDVSPHLARAEFTAADCDKLAEKFTLDAWLDLSLTELADVPNFEYDQGSDEYIPFSAASAGQQATALLRVLLSQDGPPLIIDQPEEDLDNQTVDDIVKDIWQAKKRRQLIFSSHNANIVVNGDADLVVCCDYRRSSDQSGGTIKVQGAIDIPEVRDEITSVMEGGERAFRLRKEKYGY